ncbi:MAG: DUF11 domain-containing protein [Alcanivoracaceae bacterium]|nr:DUF11 domain-containing protein [Alcanivoracaceae bacterium]
MKFLAPLFVALGTTFASALAGAAPVIELNILAEKELVETSPEGEQVRRRVSAADAAPGEVIFYTLRYSNTGDEAARNVRIDNPVPDGTEYQADSAWGDNAEILFSIDGGTTYKGPANLTYETTNNQGRSEQRRAQPEQYNAVRWIVTEIPAGQQGSVGFSVVVQ